MGGCNAKGFAALHGVLLPTIDMAHFNRAFAVSCADDLMAEIEAFFGCLMTDMEFGRPEPLKALGNDVMREA